MEKLTPPLTYLWFCIIFAACSKQTDSIHYHKTPNIHASISIVIGEKTQPFEHQLGEPMAVFTDDSSHIYIADQASLTFKVFDESGSYPAQLWRAGPRA